MVPLGSDKSFHYPSLTSRLFLFLSIFMGRLTAGGKEESLYTQKQYHLDHAPLIATFP